MIKTCISQVNPAAICMRLDRGLRATVAALVMILVAPAWASRSEPGLISERVAAADFVGVVVAESHRVQDLNGFRIEGWQLEIETAVKGIAPEVLGVAGGGWSDVPVCCQKGGRYLLFAKRG